MTQFELQLFKKLFIHLQQLQSGNTYPLSPPLHILTLDSLLDADDAKRKDIVQSFAKQLKGIVQAQIDNLPETQKTFEMEVNKLDEVINE